MRERPILMQGDMVRATLAGTKRQTRRLVKPQPPVYSEHFRQWYGRPDVWLDQDGSDYSVRCPYGQVGTKLWVRETWAAVWPGESPVPLSECRIEYRADLPPGSKDGPGEWPAECKSDAEAPKWRPSIHMPRWASRITLEVTGVRVERLKSISEDDARAEGVEPDVVEAWFDAVGAPDPYAVASRSVYRHGFQALWDRINGAKVPWSSNPWVFAIEFKRVEAGHG